MSIKAVIAEEVSHEELGGAMAHAAKSGVCHFVAENDEECIERVKTLLSYLPDSCHSPLPVAPCTDSADRECPELDTVIPDRANRGYDMKKVIIAVADHGEIFEPHEFWAKNIVVAFIRIMGRPVGVIANNPRIRRRRPGRERLGQGRAVHPVLRRLQHPPPDIHRPPRLHARHPAGMVRHHQARGQTAPRLLGGHGARRSTSSPARLTAAATSPCAPRGSGADYVMAWPSAEIAVMGAEGACNVIYRREIAGADDPAAKRRELAASYEEQFNNPYFAAVPGEHR